MPPPEISHWGMEEITAARILRLPTKPLQDRPVSDAELEKLFVVVELGDHHTPLLDGDRFGSISMHHRQFFVDHHLNWLCTGTEYPRALRFNHSSPARPLCLGSLRITGRRFSLPVPRSLPVPPLARRPYRVPFGLPPAAPCPRNWGSRACYGSVPGPPLTC